MALASDNINEPDGDPIRAATGGSRVLVADDNEDSACTLGKMLAMVGHETRVAFDGLAAVEIRQ